MEGISAQLLNIVSSKLSALLSPSPSPARYDPPLARNRSLLPLPQAWTNTTSSQLAGRQLACAATSELQNGFGFSIMCRESASHCITLIFSKFSWTQVNHDSIHPQSAPSPSDSLQGKDGNVVVADCSHLSPGYGTLGVVDKLTSEASESLSALEKLGADIGNMKEGLKREARYAFAICAPSPASADETPAMTMRYKFSNPLWSYSPVYNVKPPPALHRPRGSLKRTENFASICKRPCSTQPQERTTY